MFAALQLRRKVVNTIDAQNILFVPDQYLGHFVSTKPPKRWLLAG